jgi:hypothetical protein
LGKKSSRKLEEEKQSILDELGDKATRILGANMLNKLVEESQEVVGDFGKTLLDQNISVGEKLAQIQTLEQIALAESVKSFSQDTMEEQRLIASNHLMKLSKSLKSTIQQKHTLELQETIDFKNPKISLAFGFLIELMVKVLTEHEIEEDTLLKVIDTLAVETLNFEDKLNDALHKTPVSQIKFVKNPFTISSTVKEIDFVPLYEEDIPDADIEEVKPKKKKKKKSLKKVLKKSEKK